MSERPSSFADGLPVNLDDLLHARAIESNRIELKAVWDDPTKRAVLRTICAFANDLLNLDGGYLIVGVEDDHGHAVLPPTGVARDRLDEIQKDVRRCCERLQPSYQPLVFPVYYGDAPLVVIRAPGGDTRPYQAPEDLHAKGSPLQYYVRRGSETVQARGDTLRQLFEIAAKTPYDDRRSLSGHVEDLSPTLVRRFLHDIGSDLVHHDPPIDDRQLYRHLNLVVRVNSHEVPRNVALLFFHEDPDRFFPGARTEIVELGGDSDLIEERTFRGPVPQQIGSALDYLNSLGGLRLQKVPRQAEVERTVPYPYEAMEEAIVNAFYHRSYESPPEPVKIYLYPDRMEITSYPGPAPGIDHRHFRPGEPLPPVPARNRRLGDLLKELRLAEGRGTGIPKIQRRMRENGSPEARFDFDDERTYFRVTLPAHPHYRILNALREAGHLWVTGKKRQALEHLERSFRNQPDSGPLASQILEYAASLGELEIAESTLSAYSAAGGSAAQPFLTLAGLWLDRGKVAKATALLQQIPVSRSTLETVEAAILKKRAGDFEGAHQLFAEAYALNPDDPKLIQELAQTKVALAQTISRRDDAVKIRLNREAAELFRRAIQLSTDPVRTAWCWYDLARILAWQGTPKGEVEAAFRKAIALLPAEGRFQTGYDQWQREAGNSDPDST